MPKRPQDQSFEMQDDESQDEFSVHEEFEDPFPDEDEAKASDRGISGSQPKKTRRARLSTLLIFLCIGVAIAAMFASKSAKKPTAPEAQPSLKSLAELLEAEKARPTSPAAPSEAKPNATEELKLTPSLIVSGQDASATSVPETSLKLESVPPETAKPALSNEPAKSTTVEVASKASAALTTEPERSSSLMESNENELQQLRRDLEKRTTALSRSQREARELRASLKARDQLLSTSREEVEQLRKDLVRTAEKLKAQELPEGQFLGTIEVNGRATKLYRVNGQIVTKSAK